MKMKAAVLRQFNAPQPFAQSQPLSIEEIDLLPPQTNELLVKIGGAGLCHSDLSVINADRPRETPVVMGHEGAGEVVELGPGITDVKVGDHVVFQFSPSCGRCRRCQEGRPQVCELGAATKGLGHLMNGGSRLRDAGGNELAHHTGVSCFAEYAVVDRGSVVVVDNDLPLHEAALFGCAVMTGAGAVINTARILPGDSVAIVGLGGVGLNGLLGAKLGGAETIIAIDLSDEKLGLARQLGATHTVNASDPNHVEQVKEITKGGVDFAFDLAGTIKALETAYNVTRYGGSVVTAGLAPSAANFSFNQNNLVAQEKSIRGSYMGSCVPVRDIPRFVSLYRQGRLPVDRLIDRTVGFEELNSGFDKLQNNATVRQVLTPHAA
ncbi:MAG TPA: zinc-binding dehydrogenase [Alphaproteobacteria bacterium]|nr:zinc-binding dehydrogenase [Alphaproteobacteria bacterium]